MRSYKTEGIIIKRRNFGEGDRILSVLTKNHGKIQVKAPGVRKITSRRSSHIELLNVTLLTLYRSSHLSLPIVTEAEAQEEFLPIKKALGKVGIAYYICELIDSLCAQNQENRRVFFLVRETFFKLSNYASSNEIINDFEDELLSSLGFLPSQHKLADKRNFIESILERKLRTRRLLPLFLKNYE
jgi:DNA repair protein RecO (recombination protein O)